MSLRIQTTLPTSDAVRALTKMSEDYMSSLYPAESNHFEPLENFINPDTYFIGGYDGERLVAIGAFKIMSNDGVYGEIKRVFVHPDARGKGFSRAIMQSLENELQRRGVMLARLETGVSQPEALGLYQAIGYSFREPFGAYKPDPLSVFMEKHLGAE